MTDPADPLTNRQINIRDTLAICTIVSLMVGSVVTLMTRVAVIETKLEQLREEVRRCQK